jgi:hypothetical protein
VRSGAVTTSAEQVSRQPGNECEVEWYRYCGEECISVRKPQHRECDQCGGEWQAKIEVGADEMDRYNLEYRFGMTTTKAVIAIRGVIAKSHRPRGAAPVCFALSILRALLMHV